MPIETLDGDLVPDSSHQWSETTGEMRLRTQKIEDALIKLAGEKKENGGWAKSVAIALLISACAGMGTLLWSGFKSSVTKDAEERAASSLAAVTKQNADDHATMKSEIVDIRTDQKATVRSLRRIERKLKIEE